MANHTEKNGPDDVVKYLKASFLLQLQNFTAKDEEVKPELLLARAGFSHREIGKLLGKKPDTVTKAIRRAKS
jgi:DNA-directed RNA polymerase specialized sigma24 family protein